MKQFLCSWCNSLRGRLTFSLIAVATVPVCVLSAFFLYTVTANSSKIDQQQARLTERLSQDISSYVEMHRRGIEAAARQLSLSPLQLESHSRSLQAIIEGLHQQFPGFINLYIADEDAKTLAFHPEFNSIGESMIGADFSSRWHYAELKRNPKTHISPVMKGVGGTDRLLVTIVSPIHRRDGKAFSGFVLGALDLKKINEIASSAEMPEGSYAIVADSKGQAIARPDFEDQSQPMQATDELLIRKTREEGGGAFIHESTVNGEDVYTTFTQITSPEWMVAISRPQKLRLADQHASITAGVLTILSILGLLYWIASKFASKMAGRLEDMANTAVKFGEGNFEVSFVSDSQNDPVEVKVLRGSLMKMAGDLKRAQNMLLEQNANLEEGVRHRTALLEATITSMEEGFVLFDENKSVLYMNSALRKICGSNEGETPCNNEELLVELGNAGFLAVDDFFSQKGMRQVIERRDGSWWSIRSFCVASAGKRIGHAVMIRDVSERVKIEHMKNSLISIVAHEMKAPLAAIRMEIDTLRRQDAQWPRSLVDEIISDLDDDAGRLERLVMDWLDASRLESGSLKLSYTVLSLNDLIKDSIDYVVRHHDLNVDVAISEPIKMEGDIKRLRQVFINLLTNAVRYCDRKPRVCISAAIAEDQVVVSFEDNGIGISAENWEKVFEKFHQVDMTDTRRQGGTGLGLTICRGFIEAHGGKIFIKASDPERGTIFSIVLPLHKQSKKYAENYYSDN